MMDSNDQQQMIRDAMKSIAERNPGRTKLVYDKTKRTIVAVAEGTQTPKALNITADDADMFAVVTLSSKWIRENGSEISRGSGVSVAFSSWDGGDALVQADLVAHSTRETVTGTLRVGGDEVSGKDDALTIAMQRLDLATTASSSTFTSADDALFQASAWRVTNDEKEPVTVSFADVQPELANRRTGILETSILAPKSALFIGVGTGGSHVAIELAKCGVGHFVLVDGDRLSTGNVVRHPGGISNVGRYKVNGVRDLIYEKNPDAKIEIYPVELSYDNVALVRQLVENADIVICGTDNRPSKLLINQLCIETKRVALYGGAFRRAYGGQILRVRPNASPCHECFIAAMPDESSDVEISSSSEADAVAYSDRPIVVEPGLSLDVLPIATMLAKLALMELLAGTQSSLNVLNRDYDAPWYLWLNRPEPNTPYADWPPLSESSDEMTINRWYGIYFERDAACSVCGDFVGALATLYGLDASSFMVPSGRGDA